MPAKTAGTGMIICRELDSPSRDPPTDDWARAAMPAPITMKPNAAVASPLAQFRLVPAIRRPSRGRFWKRRHKIQSLPALEAGQGLGSGRAVRAGAISTVRWFPKWNCNGFYAGLVQLESNVHHIACSFFQNPCGWGDRPLPGCAFPADVWTSRRDVGFERQASRIR